MIVQGITDSFKEEILSGIHDLTSDVIKIALFADGATVSRLTTEYSVIGEVSGGNYPMGGATLSGISISSSGGVTFVDFEDVVFPAVTLATRGALIYNSSKANRSIAVFDFGLVYQRDNQDLTIQFPSASKTSAIIRIN